MSRYLRIASPEPRSRYFSTSQRASLARIYANVCADCGVEVEAGHGDHVVPFALGGATRMGNGAFLCGLCNAKKGARPAKPVSFLTPKPDSIDRPLRRWQHDFLEKVAEARVAGLDAYFLAAGVGAGKTTAALAAFIASDCDMLIVVVPKNGIRGSWKDDAAALGMELQSVVTGAAVISARKRVLPVGYVLTVQMLGSVINDFKHMCANLKIFAVFDEAHHLGEDMQWSNALTEALGEAHFTLAMSGTPKRNDSRRIIALNYQRKGNGKIGNPDFEFSYEQSLAAGYVAPVTVRFLGGEIDRHHRDGRIEAFSYDEDMRNDDGTLNRKRMGQLLRLSTIESSDWQFAALRTAITQLDEFRKDGNPWGGLCVCATVEQAEEIAEHIAKQGRKVMLLVKDAATEDHVARFNADPSFDWIVAITKVSEGISIPRLRVGIMLSNVTVDTVLDQIRGRLARLLTGVPHLSQHAVMFLASDLRIREYATRAMEIMRHTVNWLAEEASTEECNEAHAAALDDAGLPAGTAGEIGADDIDALRKNLELGETIDLGRYTLTGRLKMDGANIYGEDLTEQEWREMRQPFEEHHGARAWTVSGEFINLAKEFGE